MVSGRQDHEQQAADPDPHPDHGHDEQDHVAGVGLAPLPDRPLELPVADEPVADCEDPYGGERRTQGDVRPGVALDDLRHDPADRESRGQCGDPGSPPGEVGALAREERTLDVTARHVLIVAVVLTTCDSVRACRGDESDEYYTATTLNGFIADEDNSLEWLFTRRREPDGPLNYVDFIADVGAMAMGSTTYEWILDHEFSGKEPADWIWPYGAVLGLHPP